MLLEACEFFFLRLRWDVSGIGFNLGFTECLCDQGSKGKTSGVEACSGDHDISLAGFLAVFYELHCQLKGVNVVVGSVRGVLVN